MFLITNHAIFAVVWRLWHLESNQNLIRFFFPSFFQTELRLFSCFKPKYWHPCLFSFLSLFFLFVFLHILLSVSLIRFQWYSTRTMCTPSRLWSPTAMSTSHRGTPHLTYRQTWIPKQVSPQLVFLSLYKYLWGGSRIWTTFFCENTRRSWCFSHIWPQIMYLNVKLFIILKLGEKKKKTSFSNCSTSTNLKSATCVFFSSKPD